MGPFDDLPPEETIVVRFAFVAGEMNPGGQPDLCEFDPGTARLRRLLDRRRAGALEASLRPLA
jgi:hypothetical protein